MLVIGGIFLANITVSIAQWRSKSEPQCNGIGEFDRGGGEAEATHTILQLIHALYCDRFGENYWLEHQCRGDYFPYDYLENVRILKIDDVNTNSTR